MIEAAIAGETAEGHKDSAAEQRQRAALVLHHRVEPAAERRRHVDRPAGLDRSVGERKREDFMRRTIVAHDHRVEIKGRARFIDDWRAGHAERPDIAASEPRGQRRRLAELPHPFLRSGLLVERVDFVRLGRHDQFTRAGFGIAPQERLRVDIALIGRVECEVGTQAPRALKGEAGHDIHAGAIGRVVIGEDLRIGGGRNGTGQRGGERAGEHLDKHFGPASGATRAARPLTARRAKGQADAPRALSGP